MKTILLQLLGLLLLPHALAFGQASTEPSNPKATQVSATQITQLSGSRPAPALPPPQYALTDLQRARLDAARQKVWRWQDKIQDALGEFSTLCAEAQKENKWASVSCNINDLSVQPQPPAAHAAPAPPAAKETSPATPEAK